MTAKGKALPPPAAGPSYSSTIPLTVEDRIQRIEAMGQRIDGYIRFMCQVATLNGASAEAKERAVTTFYDRMIIVEKQLAAIHEELRLE